MHKHTTIREKIQDSALIPMDIFSADFAIEIDLVYKRDESPNIFGSIYCGAARLYLHETLAAICVLTADILKKKRGSSLVLYDGLRTIEAQSAMKNSKVVLENSHWLEPPNVLISKPGSGAHPRGMAIDCTVLDEQGRALDMGTEFDYFAQDPSSQGNPAHRAYAALQDEHKSNRFILDSAMSTAAQFLKTDLHLLETEWWDFRLPANVYDQYDPLSDSDLPPQMRMCAEDDPNPLSNPTSVPVLAPTSDILNKNAVLGDQDAQKKTRILERIHPYITKM